MVAGLLSPLRDNIGTTNVALVLAGIVVAAALAGRIAGLATALTAAAGFNFFHTVPYHSLRIGDHRDIITVCLLALLGIVVAEFGVWRRRATMSSKRRLHLSTMLAEVAEMVAGDDAADAVRAAVESRISTALGGAGCRYEAGPTTLQTISRSGSMVSQSMHITYGGFELPVDGLAIPVNAAKQTVGHFVVTPVGHVGTSIETRRTVVALADLYAVALELAPVVSPASAATALRRPA